ncbi:MAG: leucyl/phenylalanyl-tRNA--protein transferase [Chloroflexi bacterium]|nr:leucyl/phenylalanyl-tRNA--protein transferase [Chloroflexota bacterium]
MSLSPQLLLSAYCQGIFPMADEDGELYWYDPDPRAILPLDGFHISQSLGRTIRQGRFQTTTDNDFVAVIRACAQPGPGRETTWISEDIIDSYTMLHRLGYAHSVETWLEGELAGGLYGVAVNGLFAGESMFSLRRDASKVALVFLVEYLNKQGFLLLDVQFMTDHLRQFGAIEVPRSVYQRQLARAIAVPTQFQRSDPGAHKTKLT